MAPTRPSSPGSPAPATSITLSPLKPKTKKSKVEKMKAEPKPKVPKVVRPKIVKAEVEESIVVEAGKLKTINKEKVGTVGTDDGDELEDEKPSKLVKPKAMKKGDGGATKGVGGGVKDSKDKDGKVKEKPVTGDEAIELIARYLKEQNRPYSATEVSANLHGKVTKTVADKLMKEMEQSGQIKAKATNGDKKGSQWVFWALQDPSDTASPEELAAMESSIVTLRESLPSLKTNLKFLSAKLTTLKSAPTTSERAAMVQNLKNENGDKATKLREFQDGSVKMVTREEMEKMEKEFKYWGQKRRGRMNAYKNLEAQLLEGMTREEIEEKIGIEPDVYNVF